MTPEFIDGVQLLGTTISRKAELWTAIIAGLLFAVMAVFFCIRTARAMKIGHGSRSDLAFAFAAVIALLITVCAYFNTTTNYVVQVDDSVSINEFTENYEIVGCVNDKYVIRIKDANVNRTLSD